jgi:hypothetical protein
VPTGLHLIKWRAYSPGAGISRLRKLAKNYSM